MKKEKLFYEAPVYEAPEVENVEILVENFICGSDEEEGGGDVNDPGGF